jgi:hypothetical protein
MVTTFIFLISLFNLSWLDLDHKIHNDCVAGVLFDIKLYLNYNIETTATVPLSETIKTLCTKSGHTNVLRHIKLQKEIPPLKFISGALSISNTVKKHMDQCINKNIKIIEKEYPCDPIITESHISKPFDPVDVTVFFAESEGLSVTKQTNGIYIARWTTPLWCLVYRDSQEALGIFRKTITDNKSELSSAPFYADYFGIPDDNAVYCVLIGPEKIINMFSIPKELVVRWSKAPGSHLDN